MTADRLSDPSDAGCDWRFADRRTRLRTGLALAGLAALSAPVLLMPLRESDTEPVLYRSRAVAGAFETDLNEAPVPEASEEPDENLPEQEEALVNAEAPPTETGEEEPLVSFQEERPAVTRVEAAPPEPVPPPEPAPVPIARPEPPPPARPDPPDTEPAPAAAPGALARRDGELDDAPPGAVDFDDGSDSPQYRLESLADYVRMAEEHAGLLLAWDGAQAVLVGRSLEPRHARLTPLGHNSLPGYSRRMAPLPAGRPEVRRLHALVHERFPNLGGRFHIVLALPEALDAEILQSQTDYCTRNGLAPHGRLITTGRFEDAPAGSTPKFRILSLERINAAGESGSR